MHCVYFICKRKFYASTHVKITPQGKSTLSRFCPGLFILKKQCINYSLMGCRVLNYKVCKRDTNCQKKAIEMGTFSAGCSLLVTNFLEYIPPLGIWPFWNPIPNVVSVSNRVIARKLEGGQKKNGRGREVIPTLTTLSVNSAGRLDP